MTTPRVEQHKLDWRSVSWEDFRSTLRDILQSSLDISAPLEHPHDIDIFVSTLSEAFQQAIVQHVPIKKNCHLSNPWWSQKLGELRAKHTRLRRRWKHTRSREDKRAANDAKRQLRKSVESAKRECWRKFCQDTRIQDTWSNFKKITRRFTQPGPHELLIDDHYISDDRQKAQIFADHFFPRATPPDDAFHVQIVQDVETSLEKASFAESKPVTSQELHAALHSSSPWKAPGHDHVPLIALHQCEDILSPYLLSLYSASLHMRYVPHTWKVAHVIATPKTDADLQTVKGYRPISLLCSMGKVLETIVTSRLTHHLESKKFLSDSQYGFRKAHNAEQALWNIASVATSALQSRQRAILVSLDLESAYDRVWHKGLLQKLGTLETTP